MHSDNDNVAHSADYQQQLADIDRWLFQPQYKTDETRREVAELTIIERDYKCGDHPDYPWNLVGTDHDILRGGERIHSFRAHNSSGFYWPVDHRNGGRYLVYTQDLYGYSVLDLGTLESYRYYPAGSHPTGETFIWCDLYYNRENNVAAVDGCYWACPSSLLLVDFTDPMEDATYLDVNDHDGTAGYQDLEFDCWQGTDLVARRRVDREWQRVVIAQEQYMRWLDDVR